MYNIMNAGKLQKKHTKFKNFYILYKMDKNS